MKQRHSLLLVLTVPILAAVLGIIAVDVQVYVQMTRRQAQARELLNRHLQAMVEVTRLNQEMAAIHREVDTALSQAATARIRNEAEARTFRAGLSGRLDTIAASLAELAELNAGTASPSPSGQLETDEAIQDFKAYRNALIRAVEALGADPASAGRHLRQAGRTYLNFSEHSQHMAIASMEAFQDQEQVLTRETRSRLLGMGAKSIVVLVLLGSVWLFVAVRFSRRTALVTTVLEDLGRNRENPARMAAIDRMAQHDDGSGQIARSLLVFRDANRILRQGQAALDEERHRLRTIIDAMPDLVSLKGADGAYLDCNLRYELLFGRPKAEILGRAAQGLLQEDLVPTMAALDEAVRRTGQTQRTTAWHVFRGDGHREFMEVVKAPIHSGDGSLYAILTVCRDLTPRKEAQDRLQETVDHLSRLSQDIDRQRQIQSVILDQSPLSVNLIELPSMRFKDFNALTCELLGYTREEMARLTVSDIQTERDRAQVAAQVRDVMAGGRVTFENRLRRKDGSAMDALISLRAVQLEGQPHLVAIWTDLTDMKRAEAELRKLSLAVEQSPSTVVITDLEARIEYVNKAFTDSTGYEPAEVQGMNPRFLQSGLTPKATYEAMWAELVAGRPWTGEFTNRRKDGSLQEETATVLPLRDAKGRVTHYMALKQDVTEQKKVQDQLRKLSLAVEQSPESIVITNLDASIEYVNAAFERATGYSREEAIGLNPRVLQSGRTPRHVFLDMWDHLSHGRVWKGELINKRKDGTEYTEFAIIAPIRQPDGKMTHFLAVKDDITQQKKVQAELETYRRHLEDLVASRTAELAAATARAEEASRAKSAFLANMSHEIRTPMNAIMGLAHLLRRDTADPSAQAQLDKINLAAQHLLGVINDILDFSKIEAGRMTLDPHDFDVAQIIDGVRALAQQKAEAKGLLLSVETGNLPPLLHGDGLRLGQILLNLLTNAVKFTREGTVSLRGFVLRQDAGETWIRFEVEDTGIGLAPAEQARIFHAFEQADTSTTRHYGGTGLGLSICLRLAELMGGRMGVESTPGKGSTFWMEAPFQAPALEDQAPEARVPAGAGDEEALRAALAGRRILLVEDNLLNQEVAVSLLAGVGLQVDVAGDGVEAVALAAAQPYQLILMDVQMPRMDGLEATRRIRDLPGHRSTPILAMTANAFAEDREAILNAGMDDHVPKPVDPAVLYESLRRWLAPDPRDLGRPASRRSSEAAPPAPGPDLARRLAAFPGLDLAQGLRVFRGDAENLARLLRRFADHHRDDGAQAEASLAAGDAPTALRIAHTLKGVGGTFSLVQVQGTAADLEQRLKGGASPDKVQAALEAMKWAIGAACDAVATLPGSAPPPAVAGPQAPGAVAAARAELYALLAADDLQAVKAYERLRPILAPALGEGVVRLDRLLSSYEFEEAAAALLECLPEEGSQP